MTVSFKNIKSGNTVIASDANTIKLMEESDNYIKIKPDAKTKKDADKAE